MQKAFWRLAFVTKFYDYFLAHMYHSYWKLACFVGVEDGVALVCVSSYGRGGCVFVSIVVCSVCGV